MPEHRLLADEHISSTVVSKLNSYGIDAVHVTEAGLKGKSDEEIAEYAAENCRIILTMDDDFKEISRKKTGVLYITKRMRKRRAAEEIMKVLNSITMEELRGELIHIPWK
jgi:predicted nuclease of predicted toxin-antitoxin system